MRSPPQKYPRRQVKDKNGGEASVREGVEEDGASGSRAAENARGPSKYSRGYVRNGIIVQPVIQRCMRPGESGLGEFYCGNQVRVWSRRSAPSTGIGMQGKGMCSAEA